jgi:hypothetical protein
MANTDYREAVTRYFQEVAELLLIAIARGEELALYAQLAERYRLDALAAQLAVAALGAR